MFVVLLTQPGTNLYHAHYGMQRSAGLYGLIRVAVPDGTTEPFAYDFDHSLLLNDWWRQSTYEQAAGLAAVPFVWIEEPQVSQIVTFVRFNSWDYGVIKLGFHELPVPVD